uniref:DUF3456 domain-containing protein n=1 Tax=Caenorhabditis japonica TaxID=281687 RepID=A0A8R1HPG0_CAEJA
MNELKIHKEKTGVERFSRQPSETMNTLKQMRARGVDIQLGLPFEMWDAPSAEVTALRQGCETIIEEYEDVLEDWFLHKEKLDHLLIRLCKQEYLKGTNMECLPVSKPLRTEF